MVARQRSGLKHRVRDVETRPADRLGEQIGPIATKSESNKQDSANGAIRAELIGDDTASAVGNTVTATSPVLALCARLVEAGTDPATPLEAYRGTTLCLHVRSIGTAARLEINAKGTGFIARHAVRTAPPIASAVREGCRRRDEIGGGGR
jgi:hypothetical protein